MISQERKWHGHHANFLHRTSGKSQHRRHILSDSNETCITCWQNYPLTPLTESSLVKRKPHNLFLNKDKGFPLHCQELEEGQHGKLSFPFPFTIWLAEKDLFSQVWSITGLRTWKDSTFKQSHKTINNPLYRIFKCIFCQLQFCLGKLPIPTERLQSFLLQENIPYHRHCIPIAHGTALCHNRAVVVRGKSIKQSKNLKANIRKNKSADLSFKAYCCLQTDSSLHIWNLKRESKSIHCGAGKNNRALN